MSFSGEISVLDEATMNVIAFLPTPQKTPPGPNNKSGDEGISTQILPLARLSMSGSSSSTTTSPVTGDPEKRDSFSSPPPVPDNTFSSDKDGSASSRGSSSKVIERLRKSLTEPLLHYFHEMQVSPDSEEPEILNTPRSVIPPTNCINNSSNNNSHLYNLRRRSRNLFQSKKEGYDNVSPIEEDIVVESVLDISPTKSGLVVSPIKSGLVVSPIKSGSGSSSSPTKSESLKNQNPIPPPIITDM